MAAIKRLTNGRGVDVAIEALGTQETFEARCAAPAGRDPVQPRRLLAAPRRYLYDAFAAGLGDHRIVRRFVQAARNGCAA